MISTSDIVQIPFSRHLSEGGIAWALHSVPGIRWRGGALYDGLRRVAAGAAVELAFRQHLSQKGIAFEVKRALPFAERDRYDVLLDGRRCEIQTFLITEPGPISALRRDASTLLRAPALVASDEHAREGPSPRDLYLFAFLPGSIAVSPRGPGSVAPEEQAPYLVHAMPEAWSRPAPWVPLGRLALKSDAGEHLTIEIGGQDEGHGPRSFTLELPPRLRVEAPEGFFSISYIHLKNGPRARVGIHNPVRRETYLIGATDWQDLRVYAARTLLAGYITREEFSRRASFIPAGARVFAYGRTTVKSLAMPVADLQPFSRLFERVSSSGLAGNAPFKPGNRANDDLSGSA